MKYAVKLSHFLDGTIDTVCYQIQVDIFGANQLLIQQLVPEERFELAPEVAAGLIEQDQREHGLLSGLQQG